MFERLGEIIENNERYISDDELPEVFMWFPMQKNYIGPGLLNETSEQKTDRLIKLSKHVRSQLHRITSGLDATGEERLLEYLEMRDYIGELNSMLGECAKEPSPSFEKAKSGVTEITKTIQGISFENLVEEIFQDNQFRIGVDKVLRPWIADLEKDAFAVKNKPETFDEAREQERDAVIFAKEVRRANKLMTKLEEDAKQQSNKLFSSQLVEDQKIQFRHIAQAAATRVEQTRNLILRWDFFLEVKREADNLLNTVTNMFPGTNVELITLEENEYETGLPDVLTNFIRVVEEVAGKPVKPVSLEDCENINLNLAQLRIELKKGSVTLEKISECTEKTPSHQTVWDQTTRLKKVDSTVDSQRQNIHTLTNRWKKVDQSCKEDDLDFQPLLSFMAYFSECFA